MANLLKTWARRVPAEEASSKGLKQTQNGTVIFLDPRP